MISIFRGISSEADYMICQSILPALAYGMFCTSIACFISTVQRSSIDFIGLVIAGFILTVFALTAGPVVLLLAVIFEGVSKASFSAQAECLWLKKPMRKVEIW